MAVLYGILYYGWLVLGYPLLEQSRLTTHYLAVICKPHLVIGIVLSVTLLATLHPSKMVLQVLDYLFLCPQEYLFYLDFSFSHGKLFITQCIKHLFLM